MMAVVLCMDGYSIKRKVMALMPISTGVIAHIMAQCAVGDSVAATGKPMMKLNVINRTMPCIR